MTTNTVDPLSHTLRYRTLPMDLWLQVLPGLDPLESLTAIYLIAGPQTNRCGIFQLSVGRMAEDLKLSQRAVRRSVDAVLRKTGWRFDETSRVLWICAWWTWNPPQNRNVLIGALKDLGTVPDSSLIAEYRQHLSPLDPAYHETFIQIIGQRYPEGSLECSPEDSPQPSPEPSPNRNRNMKGNRKLEQETELPQAVLELFETSFWDFYPERGGKKIGKQVAFEKWSALPEEDRPKVSIAVKHYAASPDVQNGVGIRDAHRWLRSGGKDHNGRPIEPWREWLEPATAQPINGKGIPSATKIADKKFVGF